MGEVGFVSTLITLWQVIPITLGIVLLGEHVNAAEAGGIMLRLLAALILGGFHTPEREPKTIEVATDRIEVAMGRWQRSVIN